MNAATKAEGAALATGLDLLRQPVPDHLISKLPKGTKAQNQCDNALKKYCAVCGTRHHPDIRHLDYVGHAAATHRLLDADPHWFWEPVAFDQTTGLPKFDSTGGLWIRLTVCGVTRLGYGNADAKAAADAGAREKEVIGDAIRNAAMRFGLALDLWSKADLHADDDHGDHGQGAGSPPPPIPEPEFYSDDEFNANVTAWAKVISSGRKTADELRKTVESKGLKRLTSQQLATLSNYEPKKG